MAGAGLRLLLTPNLPAVLAGLALVGVGTFFAQATANNFVGRAATADRGSASGLYLACYFLGGLVGTGLLGQVFDRLGWAPASPASGWRSPWPPGAPAACGCPRPSRPRDRPRSLVSGLGRGLPLIPRQRGEMRRSGTMPVRQAPDPRPSEITPEAVWLRRRELLAGAAALGLAGSVAGRRPRPPWPR